jgi:hypothetical protein
VSYFWNAIYIAKPVFSPRNSDPDSQRTAVVSLNTQLDTDAHHNTHSFKHTAARDGLPRR